MKRYNVLKIPTPTEAKAIWRILVEDCGAYDDRLSCDLFVGYCCDRGFDRLEWRFQGKLGFGGKFYANENGWYVSCYSEDETPARLQIIETANAKLVSMFDAAAVP